MDHHLQRANGDRGAAASPDGAPVMILPSLLPLQYPSLPHFVAAADAIAQRAVDVEGLSPATARWFRESARAFARFVHDAGHERAFLGGELARQRATLEDWLAWLRRRGVSRSTIRTYWRGLAAVLARVERGTGMVNPTRALPAPRVGLLQPRCLTRDAAVCVMAAAQNAWGSDLLRRRNAAVVGLMLLAGLRRGEVLALERRDVDPAQGTIRVRRGKGRDGGSARTAYMTPQLRAILEAYLAAARRAGRTHAALLTSTTADRGISLTTLKRIFADLSRACGFRVSPHALRHTYATLLRMAGVPDRVSMELLGHRSLAMLQRYSHVFEGEHLAEAEKLQLDIQV